MTLIYAIGDIHGCTDQLDRLLFKIEGHRAGRPRKLVFLGDYVDAGPDSAGVLRTLRDLRAAEPEAVICLLGNHEQLMIDAYRGTLGDVSWLPNGGAQTLASYGLERPEDLPTDVIAWLLALPSVHEDALRYYVHGGFRPERRGIDPDIHTRLWIREPFLSVDFDFGKHVVHGHTPPLGVEPEVRAFRTNLDTGCVFGGRLSAGVFTDDQPQAVAFLHVQ